MLQRCCVEDDLEAGRQADGYVAALLTGLHVRFP
jgi:hypothetical protein